MNKPNRMPFIVNLSNVSGGWKKYWENFQDQILYDHNNDYDENFKTILAKYNAVDVPNTRCIAFNTEEDFVIFKLKFS